MSHIPDGLLHAYLDGALDHLGEGESAEVREHLEACAECRARLEVERELRQAAGALLADAEPGVPVMPSFEALRRRAVETPDGEGTPSTVAEAVVPPSPSSRSKGPPRGWGLAWAATIALSLGLGWAGRGMWADPSSPFGSTMSGSEPAVAVLDEASEPRMESATVSTAPSPGAEQMLRDQLRQRELESPQRLTVAEAEVQGVPPAAAGQESEAQFRATVETATLAEASGGLQGRTVPAASVEESVRSAAAQEARRSVVVDAAGRAVEAEEARRRADAEEDVLADAAPAPSEESANEKIDSDTDREPLAVPNLDILSIQPDPGVPGQPGVRILQRLHQGDTLELRYFGLLGGSGARLGGNDSRSILMKDLPNPPLEPGWNQVILQRGSGWLVARAPMTQESLEFILRLLN